MHAQNPNTRYQTSIPQIAPDNAKKLPLLASWSLTLLDISLYLFKRNAVELELTKAGPLGFQNFLCIIHIQMLFRDFKTKWEERTRKLDFEEKKIASLTKLANDNDNEYDLQSPVGRWCLKRHRHIICWKLLHNPQLRSSSHCHRRWIWICGGHSSVVNEPWPDTALHIQRAATNTHHHDCQQDKGRVPRKIL